MPVYVHRPTFTVSLFLNAPSSVRGQTVATKLVCVSATRKGSLAHEPSTEARDKKVGVKTLGGLCAKATHVTRQTALAATHYAFLLAFDTPVPLRRCMAPRRYSYAHLITCSAVPPSWTPCFIQTLWLQKITCTFCYLIDCRVMFKIRISRRFICTLRRWPLILILDAVKT